jgi:hypothetical protein
MGCQVARGLREDHHLLPVDADGILHVLELKKDKARRGRCMRDMI